ncbi:MAG: deoxyribodipyrimidine photolyase [Flavobacteriaceae bacterium]|nr:deoxyribodipyrimidine photolyase [Flavobacteriaceae bacterium]
MKPNAIFWFRRDLRLEDNHGLFEVLKNYKNVLPIFIFDPEILEKLPKDDARVNFIYNQLKDLNDSLNRNQKINTYYDRPSQVFNQLISEFPIEAVYTNHDYEPYAIARDNTVSDILSQKNIAFKSFKDQVIFERNEVTKDDGLPYKVYTPYSKKWLCTFTEKHIEAYPSENLLKYLSKMDLNQWVPLDAMGFTKSKLKIAPFKMDPQLIHLYEEKRNTPSVAGTSRLGPHLRFGTVSIRKVVKEALKSSNITFLKELIWREFFMQILWHFPHTVTKSFKPQYEAIQWRNNKEEFAKWCQGETGYPLVDAGMRELNRTGFMHNRVRMLVGSFLCKHLLIDWRWGEAYFAQKLHDFELSSNVSNWQWVAGCGVDAAPYFRIFNPTTQITKFDKDHHYIKKWVPEYQELNYVKPIVDHKFARERCLEAYKSALNR